jgi:2,4-dienoyl-CoA reductase-like NADH-dependent reductase (Old Yellow Enzyme family)
MSETPLLSPLTLRGVTLRNRLVVSPMCMYASENGFASDWHLGHLSSFAFGGHSVVFTEATAVEAEGRISHGDLGIWSDDHIPGLKRAADLVNSLGAVAGIQLAHAGRKASTQRPWEGFGPLTDADAEKGHAPWPVVGPSATPAGPEYPTPNELDAAGLAGVRDAFAHAARRAAKAGFRAIDIHGGHGYLLQSFLSPIANSRTDAYGGTLENRMRFPLEVAKAVRENFPDEYPVFYRISSVDGIDGGWEIEDSIEFSVQLKLIGIDIVDCSSGGVTTLAPAVRKDATRAIPRGLGFQVGYADTIRRDAGIRTMAVGLIVDPEQANQIVASGQADLIAVGREALFDPAFANHCAHRLGADDEKFAFTTGNYKWWLERRERNLVKLRAAASA